MRLREVFAAKKTLSLFTLLAVIGASLLFPGAASSLSLSEIRVQVRILALDSGSSRRRFTSTQINAFINEAHRQIVLDIRPILKSGSFQLVVGTTYYALPTDFLQISRVKLQYDFLPEKTPAGLDRTDRWEEVGSRPTNYFINFASRTLLGFYPFPNSTSSTGTITYDYYAQATDLSSDSDEPFGGDTELDPHSYTLAYYAAAHMSAIEGKTSLAAFYLALYKAGVERMRREAKSRPSYRPGARGGRQR